MSEGIAEFLEQFGLVGVGMLMLIENVFPPIPSELVMPWAGYAVSQGKLSFVGVVAAGSVGSFVGALLWYFVAGWVGKERLAAWTTRHGAWLAIDRHDIEAMDAWFERWGAATVLVCRMIPGIRTLISVPAGFVGMPLLQFSIYTAIGTVAWTTLLAAIGWWLGENYAALSGVLGGVSTAVVGGLLVAWLWRLVRRASGRRSSPN